MSPGLRIKKLEQPLCMKQRGCLNIRNCFLRVREKLFVILIIRLVSIVGINKPIGCIIPWNWKEKKGWPSVQTGLGKIKKYLPDLRSLPITSKVDTIADIYAPLPIWLILLRRWRKPFWCRIFLLNCRFLTGEYGKAWKSKFGIGERKNGFILSPVLFLKTIKEKSVGLELPFPVFSTK